MNVFWAIFRDSFYESLHSRALILLLVLALALAAYCFGISFEPQNPDETLRIQTANLQNVYHPTGAWAIGPSVKAEDPEPVTPAMGFSADLANGYSIAIEAPPDAVFDAMVTGFLDWREGKKQIPVAPKGENVTPELRLKFLTERYRFMGYTRVEVHHESGRRYRVAVFADRPFEVAGATRIFYLYGRIEYKGASNTSMSEYVLELERDLANLFAGMLGLIVALMVCASFVPNMLQKGTLETILARPVPRGRLLFYKYLGSLWFVFIMSTALFGVCWMAISVRTGVWNPWFLACILTITANFAVIHCVSVLFGVITRQGAIAGMIGLSFWGISGQVVQTREMMQMSADRGLSKVDPLVQKTLNTCYWILPKTTDFGHLNTLFLSRSALSEDAYQRLYATTLPKIDWAWSMGSTAVFCAVVLSFAILIFKRKDF